MATVIEEQSIQESKTTRSRSFGGCVTCRSRHVKCDEIRPTCSTCRYLGLKCGGYEKRIFFISNNTTNDETIGFRRPLSTEAERRRISELLTSNIPPKLALLNALKIDEDCESASPTHEIQINRGPFGVFRIFNTNTLNQDDLFSNELQDTCTSPAINASNDQDLCLMREVSPWSHILGQSIPGVFDEIEIPSITEFWDATMTSSDFIQENSSDYMMPESQEFHSSMEEPQNYQVSHRVVEAPFNLFALPNSISPVSNANNTIPQEAVLLLKHFSKTIIGMMTPFRHAKTPWHVLFVPHVKQCLAALTLGEIVDHANLSAFYGTLTISAFSLGGILRSESWLENGRAYKQQAQNHVKLMLKTAYDVPKSSKYKSILMALLTMLQVSKLSGDRDQMEYYFLEAEKFIRLRGLQRNKSRKVRLLHHCYAFERMIYESTFTFGTPSNARDDVRKAVNSSGQMICGQDSVSFRLLGWTNLDQQMTEVKSQYEGENDLHLEKPGVFPATMYPEIFGLPENWISLLSQVIRLGNEKEATDSYSQMYPLKLGDFLSRAKSIERCINKLQRPSQTSDISPDDQQMLDNMFTAMQIALKIYFYRRIYDMDASMLQQNVINVRDNLLRCEDGDSNMFCGSAGFVWPAFIAACEAEDREVQVTFSHWFQNSAARSGLPIFASLLSIIEQIWQSKRQMVSTNVTWLELMRNIISIQ